jgi:hypothetical protein
LGVFLLGEWRGFRGIFSLAEAKGFFWIHWWVLSLAWLGGIGFWVPVLLLYFRFLGHPQIRLEM